MKKILVIGDSWASAIESDTKLDRGWPEALDIPETHRQGVSGSTALDWAADKNRMLIKAIQTEKDVTVLSLCGNDAFMIMKDGIVTEEEIAASKQAFRDVLTKIGGRIYVLLYALPSRAVECFLLNGMIRVAALGIDNIHFIRSSNILKAEHFISGDIHPTRAGHIELAKLIKSEIGE